MSPPLRAPLLLSGLLLLGAPAVAQSSARPASVHPQPTAVPAASTPEANKAAVRRLYLDILSTGQLERLDEVIAPDYAGVRGERGPTGFAATITPVRAAFPDIQWTIDDLVAEGDRVVVRWSWRGTHRGQFQAFAPTQKVVTQQAIVIYSFREGKMTQAWMQSDRLGFLQQMGAVPLDAGVAPPAAR